MHKKPTPILAADKASIPISYYRGDVIRLNWPSCDILILSQLISKSTSHAHSCMQSKPVCHLAGLCEQDTQQIVLQHAALNSAVAMTGTMWR